MVEVYEEMRFYACDENESHILREHQKQIIVDIENSCFTAVFSYSDAVDWVLKNRDLMRSVNVHKDGKALQISGYTDTVEAKGDTIEVSCRIAEIIVEEYTYYGHRIERPSSRSGKNRREIPDPHRTPQRDSPRERNHFARPGNGK